MIRLSLVGALLVSTILATLNSSCYAKHDLSIKDGFGEEVSVKKDLFGQKKTIIKDRLGDKVEQKTGLLGRKETNINVLGNTVQNKKGWFGSSNLEATSIFGDKITSKKDMLGRRKTTVDLTGISAVLQSLFAARKPAAPLSLDTDTPFDSPPAAGNDPQTTSSDSTYESP